MVVGREGRGFRGIGGGMLCEVGDATRMRCDAMRAERLGVCDWHWKKMAGAVSVYLNRARAGNEVRVDS